MASQHILIIGGGIGGLALAQGLRKFNIPFTVFERDSSPISRSQGYRLRLAGGGADSLRSCLDVPQWDLFEKSGAEIGPGMSRLNAIDGSDMARFGLGPGHGAFGAIKPSMRGLDVAYGVDRTMLRALLLLGQDENIKFGKSFAKYEITESGVKAFFNDGTTAEGTLLVGADGVASPVRKQLLPNQRYIDTETRVIYGKTLITPELTERSAPAVLKHMSFVETPNKAGLFLEPIRFPQDASVVSNGQLPKVSDYIYWVLALRNAETNKLSDEKFVSLDGEGAKELSLKMTEDWDPSLRVILELQTASESSPLRMFSARPVRPEWKPSARVTLLGDAVHAMLPAGGSGANCALSDAALLLKLIVEEGVSENSMGKYIDGMWKYVLPAIIGSEAGGKKLLGFKGFEGRKEVDF
jgi:2-polyprenyl-6-methoxyphenol hydroxylase-like FAD-dependent oxidoreductase